MEQARWENFTLTWIWGLQESEPTEFFRQCWGHRCVGQELGRQVALWSKPRGGGRVGPQKPFCVHLPLGYTHVALRVMWIGLIGSDVDS